jgi:hypothetical protein
MMHRLGYEVDPDCLGHLFVMRVALHSSGVVITHFAPDLNSAATCGSHVYFALGTSLPSLYILHTSHRRPVFLDNLDLRGEHR